MNFWLSLTACACSMAPHGKAMQQTAFSFVFHTFLQHLYQGHPAFLLKAQNMEQGFWLVPGASRSTCRRYLLLLLSLKLAMNTAIVMIVSPQKSGLTVS